LETAAEEARILEALQTLTVEAQATSTELIQWLEIDMMRKEPALIFQGRLFSFAWS
jgi:hypothetical protein